MRGIGLFAAAAVMFLVSGCVKHSVVVQVKSDGSGVVHIRHFEEETRFGKENEIKAPTRDELRKLASKMGDGVSLRSVEMKRDANGWHGFEILFDFKDVNKLILNEQGLASLLQVNRKGGEENVTEVFVAFGEKGRKAEHVARDVGRQAASYLKSDVPVGEYLADQLMLPMAIGKAKGTGGGSYRTGPLSLHSTTHIDIIREFLDIEVSVTEQDDAFLVSID